MSSYSTRLPDDRTVRARVRDAAIELVAESGLEALTARAVATRASVSPGSVINNFGSMDGLRQACDEYLLAVIRVEKERAMATGASFDAVGALRGSAQSSASLVGYLAAVLTEDSPAVAHLVDSMVEDALGYIAVGVESGMLIPTEDPRGRAVIMTLSGLGSLVMHRHLTRLLGVDLTAHHTDPSALAAYMRPLYELYTNGLFTKEFGTQATAAMADLLPGAGTAPSAPPQTLPARPPARKESDD